MILRLLQVELEDDATSADRLRAIYAAARASMPAMAWNALKLVPRVGDTMHDIDDWLESATQEQADELLLAIADEVLALRSADSAGRLARGVFAAAWRKAEG